MRLKAYLFFVYITQIGATFFPLRIKVLGLSPLASGVVLSAPFLFALLFSTAWGCAADRLFGLKRTLRAALAVSVVAFLPFLSKALPLWATLAAYGVCQLFLLPIAPLSDALCADEKGAYGKLRLWGSVGTMAASAAAGIVDPYLLCAAGALCALFLLPPARRCKRRRVGRPRKGWLRGLFAEHRLVVLYLLAVVLNAAVSVQGAFFGIYFVNELGYPASLLGLQAALRVVGEVPFFCFTDRLDRRFGAKKLIGASVLLTGLRMAAIGVIRNAWAILAIVFASGWTYAAVQYYLVCIAAQTAEKYEAQARVQAVNNVFTNFPRITGTVFGALLVGRYGYNAVSLGAGLVVIACFFLFAADRKFS